MEPNTLILNTAKAFSFEVEFEPEKVKARFYVCSLQDRGILLEDLESVRQVAAYTKQTKIVIQNEIIELPFPLYPNLHRFLQEGRPDPAFCCIDFITYLFGKYVQNQTNRFVASDWEILPFSKKNLKPGRAVFLFKTDDCTADEFNHAALYIGHKTYFSLLENTGPLVFGSLKQMQSLYSARGLKIITPR